MSATTPPATVTQIILVGHCIPDTAMLRSAMRTLLGDIKVISPATLEELESQITPQSLLLVNRLMETDFADDTSGIELIRRLATRPDGPRLMLISNFEDAQTQAVRVGALPGFGKAQIGKAETRQRLLDAIA